MTVRRLLAFLSVLALGAALANAASAKHVATSAVNSCASMPASQRQRCTRDSRALYWAGRAAADGRRGDAAAAIDELVDLSNAHHFGLEAGHRALWRSLRSNLETKSRTFGLPFVPPESSGTPEFPRLLSGLTKRYTDLYGAQRGTASVSIDRMGTGNDRTRPLACAVADSPVRANVRVPPDYPDMARQQGAKGVAIIRVAVDRTGAVAGESVYRSTGNAALDQASLAAARQTTYLPAVRDCRPVADSYLFEADFNGS